MPMNLCDQLGMYANMILPVIMLIVIILTAVVLKRHLQNDAKQIGVLLALGIKKSQIFRHYTVFALIPAVLGSVIGLFVSIFAKNSIASICFFKIETLPVTYQVKATDVLVALLLPAILYCGFSAFQILKITRCFASTDVVTEPTPPGTGVAIAAISVIASKSTSPHRFPSSSTLMPTSTTMAPSAT